MGARLGTVSVLLTFAAGSTDLACFLQLDHVFASVMTGNLVLLGLAAGTSDGAAAWNTGIALLGYVVGTMVGVLVSRLVPRRRFTVGLLVEVLPLVAFWAVWAAGDGHPDGTARWVALLLAALAMGIQSATVLSVDSRMATTYLTSTLTRFLGSLVEAALRIDTWSGRDANALLRLAALVAGAALTAVVIGVAPAWAPGLAVVALGTAMALISLGTRQE